MNNPDVVGQVLLRGIYCCVGSRGDDCFVVPLRRRRVLLEALNGLLNSCLGSAVHVCKFQETEDHPRLVVRDRRSCSSVMLPETAAYGTARKIRGSWAWKALLPEGRTVWRVCPARGTMRLHSFHL